MTGHATGAAPAARYDAWFDSPWGRNAWRIEISAVLAALGPIPGRRTADIGCGTGRLLRILTSRGASAVGVDTDPAMLTRPPYSSGCFYWRQPGSSPRGSAPSRSSPCTPET